MDNKLICYICEKNFSSVSTKNRHLKKKHNVNVEENKSQYIKCPICPEDRKEAFANHDNLNNHLKFTHAISIKECVLNFKSKEEFETWRAQENRKVDFVFVRSSKRDTGDEHIYYNCNRSDSRGFKSRCTKRAMKTEGSIKILGRVCPSRICAKIFKNGTVTVKFVETHVGHEDELRIKRFIDNKRDSDERLREIRLEEMFNYYRSVDMDKFNDIYKRFKKELIEENAVSKKRKIEKETYFPNKK